MWKAKLKEILNNKSAVPSDKIEIAVLFINDETQEEKLKEYTFNVHEIDSAKDISIFVNDDLKALQKSEDIKSTLASTLQQILPDVTDEEVAAKKEALNPTENVKPTP